MVQLDTNVLQTRTRLGWSQPMFAEHMGVTQPTVIAWEKARSKVPHSVARWMDVVNFALDQLEQQADYIRSSVFIYRQQDPITQQVVEEQHSAPDVIFHKGVHALLGLIFNVYDQGGFQRDKE